MKTKAAEKPLSRRKMLQLLAAIGITGPAAAEAMAQARGGRQLTPEMLKTANALIDQQFSDERLRVVTTALQRNLDQFQIIRDLEIDDSVEPAPIFNPRLK